FQVTYLNTGSNIGTLELRINGTTRTNVASTDMSSTLTGPLRLGLNYNAVKYVQGSICELLVDPITLSAAQCTARLAY
ncbi:hypothetical protein, partial [Streptococcus pneumoniae]|uniref:hypothetical protein n=1 Tax=Streptococcus pneumoniae TaxID=1313 RepID=UPI0018B0B537